MLCAAPLTVASVDRQAVMPAKPFYGQERKDQCQNSIGSARKPSSTITAKCHFTCCAAMTNSPWAIPAVGTSWCRGDNLVALKALLPYYAGQVKCIYIDPPYNTGNEGWVYNDNVNSPEMREWLGRAVGKEAEDLSRHDK
jgi:hypothetical protein